MNKIFENYLIFKSSIFFDDFKKIFHKVIILWGLFAIFEGAGLSLFYPIVEFLENGEVNQENIIIRFINIFFGFLNYELSIKEIFVISIIILLTRFYLFFIKGKLVSKSLHNIEIKCRDLLAHNLYNTNLDFFIKKKYGDWISSFSYDVVRARGIVTDVTNIVGNLFLLIIYFFILLIISYELLFYCIPIIVLGIIVLKGRSNFYEKIGQDISKNSFRYFRVQEDSLKNIIYLKMRNLVSFMKKKLNVDNILMGRNQFKLAVQNLKIDCFFGLTLLVSVFYIILVAKFHLDLNFYKFAVFLFILNRATPCLQVIVRSTLDFLVNFQSLRKIIELINDALENREIESGKNILKKKIKNIKVKNLTHKYASNKINILEKVNLNLKLGQSVGLIGESGSGKSTLLNILTGFYKPQNGKIIINEQDINFINLSKYREKISYLPQNAELFNCSILENLTFGRKKNEISEKEINSCLESAHCKFVFDLPKKTEEIIGDRGQLLSGGQRQRLVIARAILNNSEILILDEATNGLDEASEKKIMETLKKIKNKSIQIICSHRISTIANTDKLIYLQKGKIYRFGNTKVLLKDKAIRNFFNRV